MNLIPASYEERTRLRGLIAEFAEGKNLVPPVALHVLEELADEFAGKYGVDESVRNWLMVEIHNCVWMPTVAAIPYDRRLLLLPKCLSNSKECEGEMDEMGLLCHRCGKCKIPTLEDRAEEVGALSMVAEGFTSVIELIENQVVDAVIGVSCLDSLEKAFPLLVNHAVPGVAVPLNVSGCHDTNVDVEYVMSMLPKHAEREIKLMNYDRIREVVNGWFETLRETEGNNGAEGSLRSDDARIIGMEWLTGEGKRWRPFLLVAVYQALTGNEEMPEDVRKAALAVECFHKASLVHDDIQDRDMVRYGKPTVNAVWGDAIAINVGDLLLGEGYRLLAACEHRELVSAIAEAHISLCQGQGTELAWTSKPEPLSLDFVLGVFKNKTVPAFEVALMLGLICADCFSGELKGVMKEYSEALGIAYQLNDDLSDYQEDNVIAHRPSAILALKNEHEDWSVEEVIEEVKRLSEVYHQKALNALGGVDNLELKRLLFVVTEKILTTPPNLSVKGEK